MRTRLAMMACRGPHTTPWMLPQGGESAVKVFNLVEGEVVTVEVEGGDKLNITTAGITPFLPRARFRVHKSFADHVDPSPTMVEVLYDG